jgi:hypothetical protein
MSTLLPPDHPDAPKYWTYESSGVLKPAVEKYLNGKWLTRAECIHEGRRVLDASVALAPQRGFEK